jgi:3-keto-disaccharide hydrolase
MQIVLVLFLLGSQDSTGSNAERIEKNMKYTPIPATVIVVFLLVGIAMVPPGESKAEPTPSGWINIMPHPSLDHWTRGAIPPDRPLPSYSQWSVDAATHTLVCAGDGGHEWLRYDRQQFSDFLFHVEWRLTPHKGGKGYNSGVFVRNNSDGSIWYQAQVGSASGGYWFGYDDPAVKGPISFNLKSRMTVDPVKPAGQWNTFDIRCRGAKLSLKVNGTTTSEFDACKNLKGYLGLEAEGSRIEFRQMRVKLLK